MFALLAFYWVKVKNVLKIGLDGMDRRFIKNLYLGQRVKVPLDHGEIINMNVGRGERQGCCMSPILFNLYGELLTKRALQGVDISE